MEWRSMEAYLNLEAEEVALEPDDSMRDTGEVFLL